MRGELRAAEEGLLARRRRRRRLIQSRRRSSTRGRRLGGILARHRGQGVWGWVGILVLGVLLVLLVIVCIIPEIRKTQVNKQSSSKADWPELLPQSSDRMKRSKHTAYLATGSSSAAAPSSGRLEGVGRRALRLGLCCMKGLGTGSGSNGAERRRGLRSRSPDFAPACCSARTCWPWAK